MLINKFSIKESLKFGWKIAVNNIGFFVVMLLGTILLMIIPQILSSSDIGVVAAIGSILSFLVGLVVGLGYIKVSLKFLDGAEASYRDFIPTKQQFLAFLIASVICAVIVGVGFIALIIPGVILGILLAVSVRFFPYYIIEKNMGGVESLKASWEVTKGSRMHIFKLLVVQFLIIIAGGALIGVGLFLAIPVVLMSQAFVYRKLIASPVAATEVA
jgi:hypothetical protein